MWIIPIFMLAFFMWIAFLLRRALTVVIKKFHENDAVVAGQAKAKEDLGITTQSSLERVFKPPNYEPLALELLIRKNVVKVTRNNKFYLSKDGHASSIENSKVMRFLLPSPEKMA